MNPLQATSPQAQPDASGQALFAWYSPGFSDAFGDRLVLFDNSNQDPLELLRLRSTLTRTATFELALRERTRELSAFHDPAYAHVLRVERLQEPGGGLAIVSNHTPGARLSQILATTKHRELPIEIDLALLLVRQLVTAVARLHSLGRHMAHGALAPERLVVTPLGELTITEYVLGSALRHAGFDSDQFWRELRIAMPCDSGPTQLDQRTDVVQIGVIALSVILNRPLAADEYRSQLPDLLAQAEELSPGGGRRSLSLPLKGWLARMLQLDHERPFECAAEASGGLEEIVASSRRYDTRFLALQTLLERSEAPDRGPAIYPAKHKIDGSGQAQFPGLTPASPPVHRNSESRNDSRQDYGFRSADFTSRSRLFETLADRKLLPAAFAAADGRAATGWRWHIWKMGFAMVAVIAMAEAFVIGGRLHPTRSARPASGRLTVESTPAGAAVAIDGKARGSTPLRVSLDPGLHALEIRTKTGQYRTIPVQVAAGADVSHYLDLPEARPTGQLQVKTPPGARILIDGELRGIAPLTIANLAPGEHEVVLQVNRSSVRHMVTVDAGSTAALVVPLATTGTVAAGWVAFSAPIEVWVFERGRLLGTTRNDRIMLTAGRHTLDLVNEAFGLRVERTVQVQPGRVLPITIDLPQGTLDINALPWAEVWIDGERIGETPLGKVPVSIGPHEVIFRHPQLGERRRTAIVTLMTPTRLSADLRQ